MDIQTILQQLREQRDQLQKAIDALESTNQHSAGRRGRKPARHMSADARARISAAMKKRWAARKKAA